jgi:hypothetical protein
MKDGRSGLEGATPALMAGNKKGPSEKDGPRADRLVRREWS